MNLLVYSWGPPGGYWIPISREKIGHIPKSREKFSVFPIPNSSPRYFVEYFVLDWETSLRRAIKQLYRKILQGYNLDLPGGCWTPISREKWYLCLCIRSRQTYLSRYHAIISYFFRLPNRKLRNSRYRHPVSRNFK